ncbi:threonine aldolase family protein [Planctomicrobium piriforme]|uniref:L-threonine aldolase n=1 Tax=Planctomicrobium piriforme TaxID=1576369 RepID=A0A1I3QK14_9PLAN|nr:GntG family PLP-dependent aldolase [Planctomicrobium piriforme]SFJ34160.1 L-threonine aldolase [Planctomicrobium piriforme]
MSHHIELRSDTFTKPTLPMRQAMAAAEVGDDMVGEDPTVNQLEARMAQLLGKPAAVFACSGTQSNQMAVWTHCHSGDELLIEASGHIANYEAGGPAALSGVSVRRLDGDFGRLDLKHLEGQIRGGNVHYSPTKLLCLENSTNIGGGRTYSLEQLDRVCSWAHQNGLKTHLDGARLFNACAARGYTPGDVAAHFDTVSICFSKGLGCPMGSILVGSTEDIARARRARKLFGGALRQAGIPAAACLYALDHHVERLREDHANAKLFAELIAEIPGVTVDLNGVETNLVFFEIDPKLGTADQISQKLKERGVLMYPAGSPYRLRACTHLDVNESQIRQAAEVLRGICIVA